MTHLDRLPVMPFMEPQLSRLPGLAPLPEGSWIVDWPDTADQLVYRDRLIAENRAAVIDCLPEGEAAAFELLDALVEHLRRHDAWEVGPEEVRVPGGRRVGLDRSDPLATIGRLVSTDFCLMGDPGEDGEYRLLGAVLCFPAHWRLAEKMGRPMTEIHAPVPQYDAQLGTRVNRVFTTLRPENPLHRVNWSIMPTPEIFTPDGSGLRREERIARAEAGEEVYLRIERQTFVRLPQTGVIAFGIRTAVAPISRLTAKEAPALARSIRALSPEAQDYKGGQALFKALLARLEGDWRPREDSNL